MPEGKTIGQLMEEMRQKAGAQNYHGHDYMDLQRFAAVSYTHLDRFQKLCEENGYEIVVFHSLRHLSTGYKLKMTNGDVKSVQGDTCLLYTSYQKKVNIHL